MQPLSDDELNDLLHQWHAPSAPAELRPPAGSRLAWLHLGWLRWLVSGTIRVPVPVGLLAMVILAFSIYWAVSATRTVAQRPKTVTLSDFQPVKQLQPRIIRSEYEAR